MRVGDESSLAALNGKLARQLDYVAARSSFYQRKFREAGVAPARITSLSELRHLPFTSKRELQQAAEERPPLGTHLAADERKVRQIQATSGTTGRPTYVPLTQHDIVVWQAVIHRAYALCGLAPGQRHLHAFALAKGYAGGIPIVEAALTYGLQLVPVGAEAGSERVLIAMRDLRPGSIEGPPHLLLHLAERAPEVLGQPASELGLRLLLTGGEPGGGEARIRAELGRLWGAEVREIYGSSDIAPRCWAECEIGEGMHFTAEGYVWPELIDPRSGENLPFEAGVSGELVYTALDREACPLVRYRQGDIVSVLGTDCRCGRCGPRIRCIGRTDDMLIVKGINLYPSAIGSVLMELRPATTGRFRIVRDSDGYATQRPVRLKVECGQHLPSEDLPGFGLAVEHKLHERLSCRFDVMPVAPGAFGQVGAGKERIFEDTVDREA